MIKRKFTGKSEEEALARASEVLGIPTSKIQYEIAGRRGGLVGLLSPEISIEVTILEGAEPAPGNERTPERTPDRQSDVFSRPPVVPAPERRSAAKSWDEEDEDGPQPGNTLTLEATPPDSGNTRQPGERGDWQPRPERTEGGERPPRDRHDRGDRRDRRDRGPRPEGDRGPRPEGDRGPRPEGDRRDRGPRPDGDRRDRGPRPDGDRGPRPEGDRGPRVDGNTIRPERVERPDRPERFDRGGDRFNRNDRGGDRRHDSRPPRPRREDHDAGGDDEMETQVVDEAVFEQKMNKAREMMEEVVRLVGGQATVTVGRRDAEITVSITGQLPDWVGRGHNRVVEALQFLANKIVNRFPPRYRIVVQVEGAKDQRAKELEEMSLQLLKKVEESGKAVWILPMSAKERRMVHMAVANKEGIASRSVGEGATRRLCISKADVAAAAAEAQGEVQGEAESQAPAEAAAESTAEYGNPEEAAE